MASRGRRTAPGPWDPNQSDPEDETYGAPSRKRKHKTTGSSTPRKRSKKRRRGSNDDDDEDISDDVDSLEEESFEDDSDGGEDDQPAALTTSGRPARGTARKAANYRESDSEDEDPAGASQSEEDEIEESDDDVKPGRAPPARQKSLRIKLKARPGFLRRLSSRSQTGGKSVRASPTALVGQRRSSRLSHDPEEPLVSLTDSGRHEKIERAGTKSPDVEQERHTRGGKQLPTTSTIIEASQETSNRSQQVIGTQNDGSADSDLGSAAQAQEPMDEDEIQMEVGPVIQESQQADDDEEDDEEPVSRLRRSSRTMLATDVTDAQEPKASRRLRQRGKRGPEESSEFEYHEDEEEEDDDLHSDHSRSPQKQSQPSESESHGRRSRRIAENKKASQPSQSDSEDVADELAEELDELKQAERERQRGSKRRRRQSPIIYDRGKNLRNRNGNQPDYRIINPELFPVVDDDDPPIQSTSRRGGGGTYRSLFSTFGPFGGAGGPAPMFGGPDGQGATGGVDSDSSDDEAAPKPPRNIGGQLGMTPTTAMPQNLLPQALNSDPAQQGAPGAPANLGKVKDKKALADADPLGVDPNVSFDEVGGLDNHVNQLKEMVMLPLLYPEIFQRFHTTPPRGVLFHGPPGTGKTLLARALAASVSSQGQKVTFYMRKGADALSKWVGEAERQLRLLFEQARQNQPSIIFFDEIDGLAPVRSSKQEQIHASIVATLLALMDGMDGRGQVIVIGATNRPDSVDPALRRPGRFDREFYFPLPNETARRAIVDIHTKGWDPPLKPEFKNQLAQITKGYGGADLRALCTEAALNAVQGTYPQIYRSNQKLIIDPQQIKVLAKDFMISVNKMIPSSGRSAPSDAKPLATSIEPLLRDSLSDIVKIIDDVLPTKKPTTALEEAEYDTREDQSGFDQEIMQQNFDQSRVFRPRLLIHGSPGMGQQFVGGALLNKFERLHVQSFDLSILFGDSAASPEATVVRLFNEVRRHKPSVIYLPNVNTWYDTVGPSVVRLFASLLRSLPPNDPVLILGLLEYDFPLAEDEEQSGLSAYQGLLKDLFGFSTKNRYQLHAPGLAQREEYFQNIIDMIKKRPSEFPDAANRPKRNIPELQVAPAPKTTTTTPSKVDLKSQKKADRHTLNLMKMAINPIMMEVRNKYKKFRAPVVDPRQIDYLFAERDPNMITTDVPQDAQDMRPYEIKKDEKGVEGLIEVLTGKFYYNLEIITIEKRLSNGYYKRPKDFLADIKRLAKDAKASGDAERTLKANELLTNVEVDIEHITTMNPGLIAACEQVYLREKEREKLITGQSSGQEQQNTARIISNMPPHHVSRTTEPSTGPVILGEPVPGQGALPPRTPLRRPEPQSMSNGITNDTEVASKPLTNGSTDPLHAEDVKMGNTEEAPNTQKSAFTPMEHGSQAHEYHNSASTTSSSQKPSDKSNASSGRAIYQGSGGASQSNGVHGDYPDFSTLQPASGGSQLPDTQDNPFSSSASQPSSTSHHHGAQSQPEQQAAQAQTTGSMPPPVTPARSNSNINNLLNDNQNNNSTSAQTSQPQPVLILDENHVHKLHEELVLRSSGCSVEQLEQLTAAMMDAIWRRRTDWNRSHVVDEVARVFSEAIDDMEKVQGIGKPSQETRERERGRGRTGRDLSGLDERDDGAIHGRRDSAAGLEGVGSPSRGGVRSLWQ